jgi:PII-like signaling protein
MKIECKGQLVRVFVSSADRWHGKPLHREIVAAARDAGMAGATVLHGLEGYGTSSRLHTTKILRLSDDLPIVVEIVDKPERIRKFMPTLDEMVAEGLITVEDVDIVAYRRAPSGGEKPTGERE